MPVKPHPSEDEYFVREEALKKKKIAQEQARKLAEEQKNKLKALHWMHCPKCGMELQTITFHGVELDRCFGCNGLWLDDGELEKVVEHDVSQKGSSVMRAVLNIFAEPKKK
jgi:Pyruvate/2-oxoacid:ferredoxin oxidoreductase delta subunit